MWELAQLSIPGEGQKVLVAQRASGCNGSTRASNSRQTQSGIQWHAARLGSPSMRFGLGGTGIHRTLLLLLREQSEGGN